MKNNTRKLNTAEQLERSTAALAHLREGKPQSEVVRLCGLSRQTVYTLTKRLAAKPDYTQTQAKRGRKAKQKDAL